MNTFSCPVLGCSKISPRPQGLSAHVRNGHPEHWKKFGSKPAPTPETPTHSVPATNPAPSSPLEHLDLAITVLRNKQEAARAEIQRLTALQAEEADLARQLEALTQARGAFAPAATKTSTDPGAVPAQVTSLAGTSKRKSAAAAS